MKMLNNMLSAWSDRANFSQKKCAPKFADRARMAWYKAVDSIADGNECGLAMGLAMCALCVYIAVDSWM